MEPIEQKQKLVDILIDYFRNELSRLENDYKKTLESKSFSMNTINIMVLIFSAVIILFSSILGKSPNDCSDFISGIILIGLSFFLLAIPYALLFYTLRRDSKEYTKYIQKESKLVTILHYLFYAKTINVDEKFFLPLIETIKIEFRDPRKTLSITEDYERYKNERLDEYIRVMDKINVEVITEELKKKS
jgi:hypothetical protein